mmetsp:Transcript_26488/g.64549  ORF Transcript_26488/g.64549 Transcript_26488/m.64549 type:complete len:183 (+) Transcript_26488:206-754(+)|eukprot:CAMPEP_0113603406 /NCGR_PEP_ID=MMETSP0017_2-20120614/1261_1 /TAXON_ID=2856 /ORGANISM="Cylindrotheca closterium" /LENGTH=182 /DNA_ID=CAMNT_0000511795 /DNA_START=130 /DNA_END=678 /DNA_ORIENTATION=- /assembly_acc=CAM_ASM_000147
MSEGGLFAWKRQEIDVHRGPAGEYVNVHKPLPNPPKGMYWALNEDTKEWSLEKKTEELVVAEVVDENSEKRAAFIEHELQKTDTFAGICLRYKITPTELRRANGGFSGTNLFLAPNPLRIPNIKGHVQPVKAVPVGEETPSQKMNRVMAGFRGMARSEAKCYLELNDWNLEKAIVNAREDGF